MGDNIFQTNLNDRKALHELTITVEGVERFKAYYSSETELNLETDRLHRFLTDVKTLKALKTISDKAY